MTSQQNSAVNVVFGAMTIGKEVRTTTQAYHLLCYDRLTPIQGADQARVHSLDDASAILDIFQNHGHNEIDTARFYGAGSSEEYLGELEWKKRGIVMDTKYYPTRGKNMPSKDEPEGGWSHEPEHLRENLMRSMKALKCDKLDMVCRMF